MRKIMLPAVVTLALTTGFAFAASKTESGEIAKIDAAKGSVTLKSGTIKTFWLGKNVHAADLKAGEKVMITYDMINKKPTATSIQMAK